MKISDYPYGKPTETLKKAVMWLNRNKSRLEDTEFQRSFDYPDYWHMPKNISSRLTSDQVDWIQQEVECWNLRRWEEEIIS